ncbi:MAG: class I SAM-dependent methyltransferase [bacterium]
MTEDLKTPHADGENIPNIAKTISRPNWWKGLLRTNEYKGDIQVPPVTEDMVWKIDNWTDAHRSGFRDEQIVKAMILSDKEGTLRPSYKLVLGLIYRSLVRADLPNAEMEAWHLMASKISNSEKIKDDNHETVHRNGALHNLNLEKIDSEISLDEDSGTVPIKRLTAEYINRLSDSEKEQILKILLPLYDQMQTQEFLDIEGLIPEIIMRLDKSDKKTIHTIISHIANNVQNLKFDPDFDTWIQARTDGFGGKRNNLQILYAMCLEFIGYRGVLESLILLPESTNKGKLLAIAAFPRQYTKTLNTIRQLVVDSQDDTTRKLFEQAGKKLMGFDPEDARPFFTSIIDFYNAVDPMPISGEANPYIDPQSEQMDLLVKYLRAGDRVLDMGAGEGRLTKPVLELGADVTAVDPNPALLAKLHDTITPEYRIGLTTKLGTMNDSKVEDGSIDLEFDFGRVVQHTENLAWTLREKYRVLKPGGILMLDFGDKDKGYYLQSRKRYAHVIQNLWGANGADFGNKILALSNHIVDSPRDEQNFLNRQVFSEEEVCQALKNEGFEIIEVQRKPIFKDTDDQNIYVVAKKIRKKPFLQVTEARGNEASSTGKPNYLY